MMKILDGFPGNVVAVHANGKLTREDYEKVLIPAVDAALAGREKVRMYYELGPDFTITGMEPGAMWDDFKLGVSHYLRWEGIAVVTDHDWVRHTINIFRFLVPGHVRTFPTNQSQEAREWIVAELGKPTSLS